MENIFEKELNRISESLKTNFDSISIENLYSDQIQVKIEGKQLLDILNFLIEKEKYSHLSMMSYADWPEKNIIELFYILYSYNYKTTVILSIDLNREKPEIITIRNLFKQAETYEIEFNEMIGINFIGNDRMGEEMILENWEGPPPMRRDFDSLQYANEHYVFRSGREDAIDVREYIREMKKEKGGLDE